MNDPEKKMNEEPEDLDPEAGLEEEDLDYFLDDEDDVPSADPVAALQEELTQTKDRMMRALADAENTRKRSLKDREDIGKYAIANFARDLLDFADNFRRAIESIPEDLRTGADDRLKGVFDGIEAMQREMFKVFDRHNIQRIEPLDEPFDPNYHEVMFEAPMPGKTPGVIIQVVEPGYVLHDRLLRAAKVGIAKDDGGAPPAPGTGGQIDREI